MFRRRWRASVSWYEIKDGSQFVEDIIALREQTAFGERDPCSLSDFMLARVGIEINCSRQHTLIFSITTLHFFMDSLLDLALENACSRRLIEPGSFKDMCRIYPIIASPSHNTVAFNFVFIYRNL